jgi:hypothetical protein
MRGPLGVDTVEALNVIRSAGIGALEQARGFLLVDVQ